MSHFFSTLPEPVRSALRVESAAVAQQVIAAVRATEASGPAVLFGILIAFLGEDDAARVSVKSPRVDPSEALRQNSEAYAALGPITSVEVEAARLYGAAGVPARARGDVIFGDIDFSALTGFDAQDDAVSLADPSMRDVADPRTSDTL